MPVSQEILVVDDNPEVLAMFREILTLEGHRVRDCLDGASAIAAFGESPTDLVITDLGMPEVSGWQVARAVRKMSPQTPIIMITAVSSSLDEQAIKEIGIYAVLRKPFRIDQITELIEASTKKPISPTAPVST